MGQEGSGESISRPLVLDAGALIALDRGSRQLRAALKRANIARSEVVVPASALAQAWRGGSRSARLSRLVRHGEIDALDEGRAKQVGERIGDRGTTDVADAHVFCCAIERRAVLVTSDPDDMKALAGPGEPLELIAV